MEITKIDVKLEGITDIMFDRFRDHSKEDRPPEQKLYLSENNEVVFPATNFFSFLLGEKFPGAIRTIEGKKAKDYLRLGHGHIIISPSLINFTDDKDKKIIFTDFKNGQFWICVESGVIGSGVKAVKGEAKPRPVLRLPWFLEFQIKVVKNPLIDENKLFNWITVGGIMVALGTYRPKFGRFQIVKWEVED